MVVELVELTERSSTFVAADLLSAECKMFVVVVERMVEEQLVVVDIVDTVSAEDSIELMSLIGRQIHLLQSMVMDIVQTDWPIDSEWVDWLERNQTLAIWVHGLHIRFEFVVALAGLNSLLLVVVDGQDLVGFEFVLLGFAFVASVQRPVAVAFAVREDVAVSINFALLPKCVDVTSNNV